MVLIPHPCILSITFFCLFLSFPKVINPSWPIKIKKKSNSVKRYVKRRDEVVEACQIIDINIGNRLNASSNGGLLPVSDLSSVLTLPSKLYPSVAPCPLTTDPTRWQRSYGAFSKTTSVPVKLATPLVLLTLFRLPKWLLTLILCKLICTFIINND